jgi:hypothetical protein
MSGEQLSLIFKDEGMSKALAKEGLDGWKDEFYKAAQYLCDSGDSFTSEDVLDLVGLPSGTIKSNANNAVGAMMNGLARKGKIRKTGERRLSKRPSSHGAELTVWASARTSENRDSTADPVPVPHGTYAPCPACRATVDIGYYAQCFHCGAVLR